MDLEQKLAELKRRDSLADAGNENLLGIGSAQAEGDLAVGRDLRRLYGSGPAALREG